MLVKEATGTDGVARGEHASAGGKRRPKPGSGAQQRAGLGQRDMCLRGKLESRGENKQGARPRSQTQFT